MANHNFIDIQYDMISIHRMRNPNLVNAFTIGMKLCNLIRSSHIRYLVHLADIAFHCAKFRLTMDDNNTLSNFSKFNGPVYSTVAST
ncbi:hypothetical protein D3C75_1225110 [compost metagenome]